MRRWLAILFVVFMPIQLGWAAVSAYCQHETGAAANHLGHHEHRHQSDGREAGSGTALHLDCGFCMAASVAALPSTLGASASCVAAPAIAPPPPLQHPQAYSTEPERPKWGRPA